MASSPLDGKSPAVTSAKRALGGEEEFRLRFHQWKEGADSPLARHYAATLCPDASHRSRCSCQKAARVARGECVCCW